MPPSNTYHPSPNTYPPLTQHPLRPSLVTTWIPIRYKWGNKVNNFVQQSY